MTNEEAKVFLLQLHTDKQLNKSEHEALRVAIKALEFKDVLDKIRAEIDKARFTDKDTRICKNALASGLEVAIDIINKYMVKSEDKV